jgi:hypothetical protein
MYAMFVMVGRRRLMAVAQLGPIATDFKVAAFRFHSRPHAAGADLRADDRRVLNGICRPFFGWVSDHIGRENTMFGAFLVEGIGIYALLLFAGNPTLFVILSGLVFFAWGEIYSLFPATCTDILAASSPPPTTGCSTRRRDRLLAGSTGERADECDRQLACRVLRRRNPQRHRRRYGLGGTEADARARDRARRASPRSGNRSAGSSPLAPRIQIAHHHVQHLPDEPRVTF